MRSFGNVVGSFNEMAVVNNQNIGQPMSSMSVFNATWHTVVGVPGYSMIDLYIEENKSLSHQEKNAVVDITSNPSPTLSQGEGEEEKMSLKFCGKIPRGKLIAGNGRPGDGTPSHAVPVSGEYLYSIGADKKDTSVTVGTPPNLNEYEILPPNWWQYARLVK